MKRKGLITATVLLFLVGLSLLLYPMASNAWNKQRSDRLIRLYEEKLASAPEADYSAAFDAVDAYNKTLAGRGVPDAFAFIPAEEDALYLSLLNFGGDGLIGYIRIPRISVSLPIYHTTTEAVLARGVGHLEGSALPVGGAGTHSVLSAHRGLPSAALFTDLNLLETGDHFYIYVLNRTLAYEVDQILEVAPDHTEDLDAVADEDYVTLVTCTPYVSTRTVCSCADIVWTTRRRLPPWSRKRPSARYTPVTDCGRRAASRSLRCLSSCSLCSRDRSTSPQNQRKGAAEPCESFCAR